MPADSVLDFQLDPSVVALSPALAKLRTFTSGLVITTPEQYADAADQLKSVKGSLATIEDARTRITKPMNESLREINAQAKQASAPYLAEELAIKRAMVLYHDAQEQLRQEQQRLENEAADRERERLQKQADRAEARGQVGKAERLQERAAMVTAPIVQSERPKVAGTQIRTVTKFRIIDSSKVLPSFKKDDEDKIGAVVKSLGKDAEAVVGVGSIEVYTEKLIASARS